MATKKAQIDAFNFPSGRLLSKKFEVIQKVGEGWEGEVYLIREISTGIERAAKFFYPQRNVGNKTLNRYAKKLHRLRHCGIVMHYYSVESILVRRIPVNFLVSEYIEGEPLTEFLKKQPGKRLSAFQGIHFLYSLAKGIAEIHDRNEYHGDLHLENIIVQRHGLGFDLKIFDFYHWDKPYTRPENIRDDVAAMIRVFYDAIGGKKYYATHPKEIKGICCGLRKSAILKKFKRSAQLVRYIKGMKWE